jgi:hypothetical protein
MVRIAAAAISAEPLGTALDTMASVTLVRTVDLGDTSNCQDLWIKIF